MLFNVLQVMVTDVSRMFGYFFGDQYSEYTNYVRLLPLSMHCLVHVDGQLVITVNEVQLHSNFEAHLVRQWHVPGVI